MSRRESSGDDARGRIDVTLTLPAARGRTFVKADDSAERLSPLRDSFLDCLRVPALLRWEKFMMLMASRKLFQTHE
jgi:hypothetical protein